MAESLSGLVVPVESVIFLNPSLREQRARIAEGNGSWAQEHGSLHVRVPSGHQPSVPHETYWAYSAGLERSSVGVVVTTVLPDGVPAVLASKRGPGRTFAGYWWMQGSVIYAYRSIIELAKESVEEECGVCPRIEGLIGLFRLCVEGMLTSTLQLNYVGFAPYEEVRERARVEDHTELQLFTFNEWLQLPQQERHWFPEMNFRAALTTMSLADIIH